MTGRTVIRKSAKWGGTVVAGVLVATWTASIWWGVARFEGAYLVHVDRGAIGIARDDSWDINGWLTLGPGGDIAMPGQFKWWFEWSSDSEGWSAHVPLWFPALGAVSVAVACWRWDASARRRATIGACATCGYSLAGLASGSKCPECGGKPGAA